jgi:hypothetical protein
MKGIYFGFMIEESILKQASSIILFEPYHEEIAQLLRIIFSNVVFILGMSSMIFINFNYVKLFGLPESTENFIIFLLYINYLLSLAT